MTLTEALDRVGSGRRAWGRLAVYSAHSLGLQSIKPVKKARQTLDMAGVRERGSFGEAENHATGRYQDGSDTGRIFASRIPRKGNVDGRGPVFHPLRVSDYRDSEC